MRTPRGDAVRLHDMLDAMAAIERQPDVPWAKIEKTRHILVHDYFDVNWDIVWMIVTDHLPHLKTQIEEVFSAEFSLE